MSRVKVSCHLYSGAKAYGAEEDAAAMRQSLAEGSTRAELFEKERPNLFRDPLVDAEHAAAALRALGEGHRLGDVEGEGGATATTTTATARGRGAEREQPGGAGAIGVSPIDPAFTARLIAARRKRLWRIGDGAEI
jgi:hypothetical protein